MRAAANGHEDTLRILLDAGADASPTNKVSSCLCVSVTGYIIFITYAFILYIIFVLCLYSVLLLFLNISISLLYLIIYVFKSNAMLHILYLLYAFKLSTLLFIILILNICKLYLNIFSNRYFCFKDGKTALDFAETDEIRLIIQSSRAASAGDSVAAASDVALEKVKSLYLSLSSLAYSSLVCNI
jgi:ankyrin repeat protein